MKVCIVCNIEKVNLEFNKDSKNKDGLTNRCKSCQKEYKKEYQIKNKEKIAEKKKIYQIKNKIKIAEAKKKYRELNKEDISKKKKIFREANKEKIAIELKNWRKNNKEKVKEYRRKYEIERKKADPLYKLIGSIRTLIGDSFKRCNNNYIKSKKTEDILGCSVKYFRDYIELKFTDGMSWDNRNKWHIDHIIPVSSAKTEEEIIKLNHYTNLQPLWAEDNWKKGSKIL